MIHDWENIWQMYFFGFYSFAFYLMLLIDFFNFNRFFFVIEFFSWRLNFPGNWIAKKKSCLILTFWFPWKAVFDSIEFNMGPPKNFVKLCWIFEKKKKLINYVMIDSSITKKLFFQSYVVYGQIWFFPRNFHWKFFSGFV